MMPKHSNSKPDSDSHLRFFTAAELAEILKMHPQVITRKLQSGAIAGYKLGKDWRISEAQLLDFLERHSNTRAQDI
jgi:excisionase family DNA binding protein